MQNTPQLQPSPLPQSLSWPSPPPPRLLLCNHARSHSHCPGPAPPPPGSYSALLAPPWCPQSILYGPHRVILLKSPSDLVTHSVTPNPYLASCQGSVSSASGLVALHHPCPLPTSPATSGFLLLLGHSKLTPIPEPPCWLFPLGVLCPDTHVWVFNQMSPHQSGLPCWFCGHPRHFLSLQLPSLHHTIYYHLRRICFSMVSSVFTLGT